MTSPSTEAGRALHFREHWGCRDGEYHGPPPVCSMVTAILAIEAEAREQALAEIEEAVRGLDQTAATNIRFSDGVVVTLDWLDRTAVLAAIETARRNPR